MKCPRLIITLMYITIKLSFRRSFTLKPKRITPASVEWLWWVFITPHDY
jgi:hypothetical protein